MKFGRQVRVQVLPGPSRRAKSENETARSLIEKIAEYLDFKVEFDDSLTDAPLPSSIEVTEGQAEFGIAAAAKVLGGDWFVEGGDVLKLVDGEASKSYNKQEQLTGTAEGKEWTGDLKIKFDIERKTSSPPDACDVSIYNLSDKSISFIRQGPKILRVFAGYNDRKLLFQGDVSDVEENKSGGDREVVIKGGDGYRAYSNSTTLYTNRRGANVQELMRRVSNDMGLAVEIDDNVQDAFLPGSTYLSGTSRSIMGDLASTVEADWFIFENTAYVKPKQRFGADIEPEETFVVSADTGMVGRPKKTEKGIEVKSLLINQAVPHKVFRVKSRRPQIGGWYLARNVRHQGDTRGKNFYTTIKAEELES